MKRILEPSDLAINGAQPAFEHPLHVGRPSLGDKKAFLTYVESIFDRRWLTNNGPLVQELERKIADLHGVKHCISMCNGTIALEIAIRALGLSGEVIVPSYTFIATAHALHWQAITPVFADINPLTHNIDPASVRKMITPRTTGIIGVHLWGRGAPVDELQDIAQENNLALMFDAAHAFGCSYKGKMIGHFGRCEILSFHATKCFNTFEGGAVLTNDDDLAQTVQLMRNFGFTGYDKVIHPGTNGKMPEVSAAMGLVNLDIIDDIIATNRTNYQAYRRGLENASGVTIFPYDETDRNNYQYIVMELTEDCPISRNDIIAILHAENILARKYFWPGCHNMSPYKELFPHAKFLLPNTELVAERTIVLPTGMTIGEAEIDVITSIIRFITTRKSNP